MSTRLSRFVVIGLLACAFELIGERRPQPQQIAQAIETQATQREQSFVDRIAAPKPVEGRRPCIFKFIMR